MNGKKTFREELRVIPGVAWGIALTLFIALQLVFPEMLRRHPKPPAPVLQHIAPFFLGLLVGAYVLLFGYVMRDARRRGMSRPIWALVLILVPNGLGFVVYFLMRRPILTACPKCQAMVREGSTYCQNCGEKLALTCPSCGRPVVRDAHYCEHCGTSLRPAEPVVRT